MNGVTNFHAVRNFAVDIADAVRATKRIRQLVEAIKPTTESTASDRPSFLAESGITFNMGVWGVHYGDHEPGEQNYCGTAACALGTAALLPAFQIEGLRAQWVYNEMARDPRTGKETKTYKLAIRFTDVNDYVWCETYAGQQFFGLTENEAADVFTGTHRTKLQVIRVLQKLARNRMQVRDLRNAGIDFV